VWCTADARAPRPAPFNLNLLPIAYAKDMEQSYFKAEYDRETTAQWMDNLNVLYVAYTRAKYNLIVLSKEPPAKPVTLSIESLLTQVLGAEPYERGAMVPSAEMRAGASSAPTSEVQNANPFRDVVAETVATVFAPQPTAVRFKQTTGAARFVKGEDDTLRTQDEYIREGNLIHRIFEQIVVSADIPQSVHRLVEAGIIEPDNEARLREKVSGYITTAGREEWFSDRYRVLNECTIMQTQDGEPDRKRCDRVMIDDHTHTAIVVDYKTGAERDEHIQQVREYMHLLAGMGYPQPQGYVWYLNCHKVLPVNY
jgi:ATP-dependent exoDNAse (exonuclease V) beta subunit